MTVHVTDDARPAILVLGGTGTIGRAVVELALGRGHAVTVLSRGDTEQAEMVEELGRPARLRCLLGDVRDLDSLPAHVGPVIHCAALKSVPAVEAQPLEGVRSNVLGTANALEAYGTQVTLVSTDKAVQPLNAYGATKLLAERMALAAGARVVRLVNVTGSRGSLLPLAERQAQTGRVFLTDERMRRWMMPAGAAASAIMATALYGCGGVVHLPKDAREVRIADIIQEIAERHRVPVEVTGARPGEKLAEVMQWPGETVRWV